jgi:hypothetical protein
MPTLGLTHGNGRTSHYDPLLNPTFTTNLWKSCPLLEYIHDPSIGVLLDENFVSYNAAATTGDYVLTQATAGTGAISTAAPGVFELDCNSTTQGQGAQVQRAKSAFVPAAGKHIWAEWKFKVVDTFDKVQLFVGLAEIDTSIIASGAISTSNHVGLYIATAGAGVATLAGAKAAAATTKTLVTIAEATYIRFGLYFDGVTSVQGYINGVSVSTALLATANVPIVALYPSLVCQTDDTNDPILHVQGYRIFQLK